jgi:hypothetical protein
MDKINILNKTGLLSDEDRKAPLSHGCNTFTFETCLDLSMPIKVIPHGTRNMYSLQEYSKDVASFICWWTLFVRKDLNGFSGFHHVQFELVGFEIVTPINDQLDLPHCPKCFKSTESKKSALDESIERGQRQLKSRRINPLNMQ